MGLKKIFFWGMVLLSFPVFSQKYLLDSAEQALDRKQYEQMLTLLSGKDSLTDGATNQQQAYFYYLKASAYSGLALSQKENKQENSKEAIRNFNLVKEVEEKELDSKLTEKSRPTLKRHLAYLVDTAIDYNQNKQYNDASRLFNSIYSLSPKDTLFLYYSASMAVKAEDYDFAESKYRQLIDLKYNGSDTLFLATNVELQRVESFGHDKNLQELGLRQQKYSNSDTYVEKSKWAEINANLGLILFNKQNYSEAESFLLEGFNADNSNLNVGLAVLELYQKTNRNTLYLMYARRLMRAFPDNPLLQYNIGVYYYNRHDFERAERYFKNAIENKFSSENAHLMLANIALAEDAEITQKLNELMNKKYAEEYQQLYQQKTEIYESALDYLKQAVELNPENSDIQNLITDIQQFLNK
ncbi:tetratricopeptide repeat protein [Avrilella dinanensis]|nr:tetratricopeptide repeat protein [Avrilella dinanensis]